MAAVQEAAPTQSWPDELGAAHASLQLRLRASPQPRDEGRGGCPVLLPDSQGAACLGGPSPTCPPLCLGAGGTTA